MQGRTDSLSSRGTGPGRRARRIWPGRRAELGLLVASTVVVALTFLLWTGVVPGVFPASPTRVTLEVPTCVHAGGTTPYVEYRFPMGAQVHLHWGASSVVGYFSSGEVQLNQLGTSGNASFTSHASPTVFYAIFAAVNGVPPGCPFVNVTTVFTYSV